MERRHVGQGPPTPTTVLGALPADAVLDRLPVPVLAIAQDGAIVFANAAFADLLGHTAEAVGTLSFHEILHTSAADGAALPAIGGHEDLIVELAHRDGSIVRAKMNSSALRTDTDPVALATFQDLTEHLWVNEL